MDFPKRLVEVEEVLRYLPKEYKEKLPEKLMEFIDKNKAKDYVWKIDKTKKLGEQNLPDDTIAILSYINLTYLLNPAQKDLMEKFYELFDRQ